MKKEESLLQQVLGKEGILDELIIANEKNAAELSTVQNKVKEERADEVTKAKMELVLQKREREKREDELIILNGVLDFQNKEREKREDELIIANKRLAFENKEKEKLTKELIIAKIQAEEGNRLKSAFIANMSHEIRTPMNGILGFTELLKTPNLTRKDQHDYISIIEKSGERLLNIINDIIIISQIESGQMEISVSGTNINKQIEFICTFFRPEADKKGIKIFFENLLPASKAFIKTDREKIFGILKYLVNNAIKFTCEGSVEIGYKIKDKYLEFFVKDTGSGIRQEQMEFIFERFRQGDDSYTRNYEGAGLGLSISKAYVEMLGGKIWIKSEKGKGSIVYFTIPYNQEPEENKVIKNIVPDGGKEGQIKNLKILVAEDDEVSQTLIEKIVQRFSQKILNAKTGVKAIEICRKNPDLDLVLMDIKMAKMDGYEATRKIRQFNKEVVIIAQTAYAQTGDREMAIKAGCNDYISKPFNLSLLTELIGKHFNYKKRNNRLTRN